MFLPYNVTFISGRDSDLGIFGDHLSAHTLTSCQRVGSVLYKMISFSLHGSPSNKLFLITIVKRRALRHPVSGIQNLKQRPLDSKARAVKHYTALPVCQCLVEEEGNVKMCLK